MSAGSWLRCAALNNIAMSNISPASIDLEAPVVVVGSGGSGTRLFADLLRALGVFMGSEINRTSDSVEWVLALYPLAIQALQPEPQGEAAVGQLRSTACAVVSAAPQSAAMHWGWKLPETTLCLAWVLQAFPRARVLHVVRNPLDTCLRRSHVTSRLDKPVGAAVLERAWCELGLAGCPEDATEHMRNAASWALQVRMTCPALSDLAAEAALTLRLEQFVSAPQDCADVTAGWPRVPTSSFAPDFESARLRRREAGDSRVEEVWPVVAREARALGYAPPAGGAA